MRRLVLRSFQSPGDILMLTAAVRDLHAACPGQFQTDVRTSADAIWENNPHITPLKENEPGVQTLDMHYPLIHQSNQRPYHFIHGYTQYLEEQLGLTIPATRFHGDVYLTDKEKEAPGIFEELGVPESLPFWIIVAGGKHDFTAKWWNPQSFQKVVDRFKGRIHFAQCGEAGHWHPPLDGVTNLVGKTTLRQFIRLVYHAVGVVCPVTLAMHLAAAVETRDGRQGARPCVVVAGGREPAHWEAYPNHQFISTNGALPCCAEGGCWKSRCQLVGDGDPKDSHNVCHMPVHVREDLRIAKCMEMIEPEDVIGRVELYYRGGALQYKVNARETMRTKSILSNKDAQPTGRKQPMKNVIIKFRHGLGDAVQLTSVLRHLHHYHPDWRIKVASLVGKHSAFHGLCDEVSILDGEPPRTERIDGEYNLDWHECATCYADSPSTKADRCLREVFELAPMENLCRYVIKPCEAAIEKAHRYLRQVCQVSLGDDCRYPVVLIHYEGNTSSERKDLPHEVVRILCENIIRAGCVPIILDWDNRSPLPDGKRIHNPRVDLELWDGMGTGDAAVLAALTELSTLMIGVDSGPLHVAGATSTPTIAVWTGHHPLHYMALADNITHLVPENHRELLRGNREVGETYFREHYRYQTYNDLEDALVAAVEQRLKDSTGALVYTRNFWIRSNNAQQDLVVVKDIAEDDSYHIAELPMPWPVVVDVGAHIGCFSRAVHQRNPLARILAIECCPENIPALQKNVSAFATVIQAAMTYDKDVALLNAVFANCHTTGGSVVAHRSVLQRRVEREVMQTKPTDVGDHQYWVDLREMKTLTLEDIIQQYGLDRIDILKLDCEGSEFSILQSTTSLDMIGLIVGEYHGKERFLKLVAERFVDWKLRILKDGELGTFWLQNPQLETETSFRIGGAEQSPSELARVPVHVFNGPLGHTPLPPLLIAALRNDDGPRYDLLLMDQATVIARYEHPEGWLRGFSRLGGKLWTIDSKGALYTVEPNRASLQLRKVSTSPLALEAHDLTVIGRKLVTVGSTHNAIVLYDPQSNRWEGKRPWIRVSEQRTSSDQHDRCLSVCHGDEPSPDHGDQHHLNSITHDGEKFILSMFTCDPKPAGVRWRDSKLDEGLIVRWGADGFDDEPLAADVYVPHSLRLHDSHLWWCESFRARVCRDDGWHSPPWGGFARGLRFVDGQCLVGLSKSRVAPNPTLDVCGVCVFDPRDPASHEIVPLEEPYFEIHDIIPVAELRK